MYVPVWMSADMSWNRNQNRGRKEQPRTGQGKLCLHWSRLLITCLPHIPEIGKIYHRDRPAHSFLCCHTETETVDQTCYLMQPQNSDTRLTRPCTGSTTPGVIQNSHENTNLKVTDKPWQPWARSDPWPHTTIGWQLCTTTRPLRKCTIVKDSRWKTDEECGLIISMMGEWSAGWMDWRMDGWMDGLALWWWWWGGMVSLFVT